jgi:hypothetical protein
MQFVDRESTRALGSCALRALALGLALLMGTRAEADGYSECSQILAQDIFNKIVRKDSSSSVSMSEMKAAFFRQGATEAYDAYRNARSEAKKNGTKIDTEFHYGIIGGELGIDLNSEKEVSSDEFTERFTKAQETYKSSTSSRSSSSHDLMNSYASYVRDPATVDAWRDCVTRTRETNLYAFAGRDQAKKTYINVVWVPGPLAGSVPAIEVSFVTDGDAEGVTVHANPEEQVAMGSGRNFAVSCGTRCDNGFRVVVNGTLKNATGQATSSFTSAVEVPPLQPPASSMPVIAGVWKHILDATSLGAGTLIEEMTFIATGEGTYEVLAGRGRDASKGIATLAGNRLQANFVTPLSGSVGQVAWELNSSFTEGAGTVTLHVPQLDEPLVVESRIVRTR